LGSRATPVIHVTRRLRRQILTAVGQQLHGAARPQHAATLGPGMLRRCWKRPRLAAAFAPPALTDVDSACLSRSICASLRFALALLNFVYLRFTAVRSLGCAGDVVPLPGIADPPRFPPRVRLRRFLGDPGWRSCGRWTRGYRLRPPSEALRGSRFSCGGLPDLSLPKELSCAFSPGDARRESHGSISPDKSGSGGFRNLRFGE
jgi:hypothetical protein